MYRLGRFEYALQTTPKGANDPIGLVRAGAYSFAPYPFGRNYGRFMVGGLVWNDFTKKGIPDVEDTFLIRVDDTNRLGTHCL